MADVQVVTERPLTFVVRAVDGRVLDQFREDELTCVKFGAPEKSWHEAACWAYIAIAADRKAQAQA